MACYYWKLPTLRCRRRVIGAGDTATEWYKKMQHGDEGVLEITIRQLFGGGQQQELTGWGENRATTPPSLQRRPRRRWGSNDNGIKRRPGLSKKAGLAGRRLSKSAASIHAVEDGA